jgi:hypothetical protein
MIRSFSAFLLFFLFISCQEKETIQSANFEDEVLMELTGNNLSDKIRIPVSAFGPVDTSKMPKIHFANPSFNFDTIVQGESIEHTFQFENTGNDDLYILDARVSCGCTVASYPKEAIAPNEKGEINVTFDSNNRRKDQNKNIIIISNTYPNETSITLGGFVKENK